MKLEITKKEAKKIYADAPASLKEILDRYAGNNDHRYVATVAKHSALKAMEEYAQDQQSNEISDEMIENKAKDFEGCTEGEWVAIKMGEWMRSQMKSS